MHNSARTALLWLIVHLWFLLISQSAFALNAIRVTVDADAIDLTNAVDHYSGQGDKIQVATAPGGDKIERRIEVSALEAHANPAWIVFALSNDSDEQLTRLIVAPHYRLVGSGVIWPDLGSTRITTITASQGAPPEREDHLDVDVFRVTIDPGATITYVAELKSAALPQLYLWEPEAYKDNTARLTLYQGIVIGVAGLLALFLTMVFVVRGALMFPASAALGWAVFLYVCIDFGFWRKIFNFDDDSDRVWRAGAEATIGTALIVFLFAYLNIRRWYTGLSRVGLIWLLAMPLLVGMSIYNAPVASGVARMSIASVAGIGLLMIMSLAARGSERAVLLIPTWFLLCLWVSVAAGVAVGPISSDLAAPGLIGGLVLIVMLVGFTVMQSAFANTSRLHATMEDVERRALAITGSGDTIFDWAVASDQIHIVGEIESHLGLKRGELEGPAANWLNLLHPLDRERYVALLEGLLHNRAGRINHDVRLRGADGRYSWFQLKARPVISADGEVARVIGVLSDVTETKASEERILHDAVHDNLTGLPNRELFLDRLEMMISQSSRYSPCLIAVLVIDVDQLKSVNASLGLSFGDSTLLAVTRRIGRDVKPGDTLARIGGDQFGAIVLIDGDATRVVALGEEIRGALSTPISFGDREIALTACVGCATFDKKIHARGADVVADAELALANAKREGGDRVAIYIRALNSARKNELGYTADLRGAVDRGEFVMLYEPIVRLEDRTVAGFHAKLRWRHPRHGMLSYPDFMRDAETSGVIEQITAFALESTGRELSAWQRSLEVVPPMFASLEVFYRNMLNGDWLDRLRSTLASNNAIRNTLKLEFPESMLMENPEYAALMLPRARESGAGLALSGFGAGRSSFPHWDWLKFDTVKITPLLTRPGAAGGRPSVLRPIIAVAKELGVDTIVEGVETESDAVAMAQLGCTFAQGPAFGKTMDAAQVGKLVGVPARLAQISK